MLDLGTRGAAGRPVAGVGLALRRHHEERESERIQRALAEQELILDNASVGIAFVRNRAIQRCNRFLEDMVGAGPGELIGQSWSVLFDSREEWEEASRIAYSVTPPGGTYETERRFSGRRLDVHLPRARPAHRPGRPEQEWIWSFEDVTVEREADLRVQRALGELERAVAQRTAELEEAKARAQHLADHDRSPGCRTAGCWKTASRRRSRSATATARQRGDVRRHRPLQDHQRLARPRGRRRAPQGGGEPAGDQLREGDTICRIGGDEFVVVLPEVKRSSDVAHVAQKVIEQLSRPVIVEERELVVTCSIGIAIYPDDGRDAETLIRNADAAMYHAKELGRANYQFFTEQMNQSASRRLQLESDLRRALGKDELRLHYQPIVETASGRVAAHEALARWQHPERGLVLPAEFIQLAEETGVILKIGEWVLAQACRWSTFIGVERGLQIAVNLSARQFNDPQLPRMVARAQGDGAAAAATRARDHRVDRDAADRRHAEDAQAAEGPRRVDRHRRLRHRLLEPFLPAPLPGRQGEDRPQLRLRSCRGPRPGRHHLGHRRARARAPDPRGRGGRGDRGAARFLASCGCDFIQGHLVGRPGDADSAAKEYV